MFLATIALAFLLQDVEPSDPNFAVKAFGAMFIVSPMVFALSIWLAIFTFLRKRRGIKWALQFLALPAASSFDRESPPGWGVIAYGP